MRRHELPDKELVNKTYTHNLRALVKVAGLESNLEAELKANPAFAANGSVVKDWSTSRRYDFATEVEAKNTYKAMSDRRHGVMRWIKQHW